MCVYVYDSYYLNKFIGLFLTFSHPSIFVTFFSHNEKLDSQQFINCFLLYHTQNSLSYHMHTITNKKPTKFKTFRIHFTKDV